MNIEEERKAFDEWVMSNSMQSMWWFDVWLAAKVHAEEMAKPTCYVRRSSADGKWWVDSAFFKTAFNTKSQAIFHAKDNGYRVVSE